jgi:hypothetical protein
MSNAIAHPSRFGALSAARTLWVRGLEVRSELRFALGVSCLWLGLYNTAFWQQAAAAMWYPTVSGVAFISDHGESLGEQGVYLHGLPYSFAPQEQTHVPFIFWASSAYLHRTHLQIDCARSHCATDTSHDSVYHTVLGLTEVRNDHYRGELDVLSTCRPTSKHGHE